METLQSFLLLGGWIGVIELLWTAYDEFREEGKLQPKTRAIVYCAVLLGFLLLEASTLPLTHM